jgi:hypothetical protein
MFRRREQRRFSFFRPYGTWDLFFKLPSAEAPAKIRCAYGARPLRLVDSAIDLAFCAGYKDASAAKADFILTAPARLKAYRFNMRGGH